MAQLNISERQAGDVTVLDMEGDVIFGDGNVVLRHTIRRLMIEDKKNILLNFSGVGYIDSSGIGELVSGLTAVNREDGELKLMNLGPRVTELLAITKLLTIFETFESERRALDSYH